MTVAGNNQCNLILSKHFLKKKKLKFVKIICLVMRTTYDQYSSKQWPTIFFKNTFLNCQSFNLSPVNQYWCDKKEWKLSAQVKKIEWSRAY